MESHDIPRAFILIPRKFNISVKGLSLLIFNPISKPKSDDKELFEIIKLLRRYRHVLDAVSMQDNGLWVTLVFRDDNQAKSCLNELALIGNKYSSSKKNKSR